MEAGRELDALVAEKVMGWRRMAYEQLYPNTDVGWKGLTAGWYDGDGLECELAEDDNDWEHPTPAWSPSTDIEAAWQAEERIAQLQLDEKYAEALKKLVSGTRASDFLVQDERGWGNDMQFKFIHATPEKRCIAMLEAVE